MRPLAFLLLTLCHAATIAAPPVAKPVTASAPAQAASSPQTGEMIAALRPSPTRAWRNLQVRQKPADGSAPAADGGASGAAVAEAPAAAGGEPSLALAIQFETNSARVRPESGEVLGNLVAAMMSPELRSSRFVIEGHADGRGAATANQRLSQDRADEVRLYLVALGVQPARLKAVGKGASVPANGSDPLAPENRRVRVVTVE